MVTERDWATSHKNINFQIFNEFRCASRAGQTACCGFSSPFFLFPFFLYLPLREQSLLPQSVGTGDERGWNKLESLSVRFPKFSLICGSHCSVRALLQCSWEAGSLQALCCTMQVQVLAQGCSELGQLYNFFIQIGTELFENKRGHYYDCTRTQV